MVERVECAVSRDDQLELDTGVSVVHCHGDDIAGAAPEERDEHAVVFALIELDGDVVAVGGALHLKAPSRLREAASHRCGRPTVRPAGILGCGWPYSRRKARTASTRRWSSELVGSRSFAKMLVTCFSTARSVTTMRSAIALFDRPSAISSRTSRSRGVTSASGSEPRRRPTRRDTIDGSS